MGALNLDAEEIKKHKLIQEKQEMVEVRLYVCIVYVWWLMGIVDVSNLTLLCTSYVHTYTSYTLDAQRMHMLYTTW